MNEYHIWLKDRHNTFNINMCMFRCMAQSKEEAIGKMVLKRKDLNPFDIRRITENDFVNDPVTYSGI